MKIALFSVACTIAAGAFFTWGMAVRANDEYAKALYSHQHQEFAGRGVCGESGSLVRVKGFFLCVYVNEDGTAAARPVFDSPIGLITE